jgi:hypothetical protein
MVDVGALFLKMNGRERQSTGAWLNNELVHSLNHLAEKLQLASILICKAKSANATRVSSLTKVIAEDC